MLRILPISETFCRFSAQMSGGNLLLCLTEIPVVGRKLANLGFVLGNKVAFGSVNANREYFETGVKDLCTAELQYPGWLKRLLTHRVSGLENYGELMRLLTEAKGSIKVYCQVAAVETRQTSATAI